MPGFKRNTFNVSPSTGNASTGIANLINILSGNGDPGGRLALQGQLIGGRIANQNSRARNLGIRGDQLALELEDAMGLRERNPAGTPRGDSIRNKRSADTERGLGLRANNEAQAGARDKLADSKATINIGGKDIPLAVISELFPGGGIKSLAETGPSIKNIENQIVNRDKKGDAAVKALEALGLKRESGADLNKVKEKVAIQGADNKTRLTDSKIGVNDNRIDLLVEKKLTQKEKTASEAFKNSVQVLNNSLDNQKTQAEIKKIEQQTRTNLQAEGLNKSKINLLEKKIEDWTNALADDAKYREIYGFGTDASKDIALIGKTKALLGLALAKTADIGKAKKVTGTGRLAAIASLVKQSLDEDALISNEGGEKVFASQLTVDELSSHVANLIDGMTPDEIEDVAAQSDAADTQNALGLDQPLEAPTAEFDGGTARDVLNQLFKPDVAVSGDVAPTPPAEPTLLEQAQPELSAQPQVAPAPVAEAQVIQQVPQASATPEIAPDIKLSEPALLKAEEIFAAKGIDGLINLADSLDKAGRTKELAEILKLIQLKRAQATAGVP